MSELDTFIVDCTAQADPVMGTDSITLGTVTLTGVWSGLSKSTENEFGGMQQDVSASVCVPSAADVTLSLIGKIGTVKGTSLKCINLDIGEALTTVFFDHASQTTSL
jgi:hypothetical protein